MNAERYIRQTILNGFGAKGQQRLSDAKVLVIGVGGLGIPVLTYLNAMGVGTLGMVDGDTVSRSNLHRQPLFQDADVGKFKVAVAYERLLLQNPDTQIQRYPHFITRENALELISGYDVVVDASDNFPTRYLVNDACIIEGKPLIYGALHAYEGQVSVFNFEGGPTYRCLYPKMPGPEEVPNCEENGVLGILPGIIGNLQALETVKVITGLGTVLSGYLMLYDGLGQTMRKIKFSADAANQNRSGLEPEYEWVCDSLSESIEASELPAMMEKGNMQLVDVRTKKEFDRSHLDSALHIPLGELERNVSLIDFDRPVYFICQSGVRSRKAIDRLRESWPDARLVNVTGGMNRMQVHAAR